MLKIWKIFSQKKFFKFYWNYFLFSRKRKKNFEISKFFNFLKTFQNMKNFNPIEQKKLRLPQV